MYKRQVLNPISYVPVRLHYLPQTSIRKFEFGIHSGIKFDTKLKYSAYAIGTHIGYNLNQKWSLSVSPTLNIEQGNFLIPVSYTHLRAHETVLDIVCRLLLEKKKTNRNIYILTH